MAARGAWVAGVVLCAVGCLAGWPGGIHAVVRFRGATNSVVVEEVPQGGAAATAGLRVNDEIVSIEGSPVRGMSPENVRQRLRGEVGTRVRLRVSHDGEERDVVIERAPYRQ